MNGRSKLSKASLLAGLNLLYKGVLRICFVDTFYAIIIIWFTSGRIWFDKSSIGFCKFFLRSSMADLCYLYLFSCDKKLSCSAKRLLRFVGSIAKLFRSVSWPNLAIKWLSVAIPWEVRKRSHSLYRVDCLCWRSLYSSTSGLLYFSRALMLPFRSPEYNFLNSRFMISDGSIGPPLSTIIKLPYSLLSFCWSLVAQQNWPIFSNLIPCL